jgi:hypothetical protein
MQILHFLLIFYARIDITLTLNAHKKIINTVFLSNFCCFVHNI